MCWRRRFLPSRIPRIATRQRTRDIRCGAVRAALGRGNPVLAADAGRYSIALLDLWSGSLWRMSRLSELKATGAGKYGFPTPRSPEDQGQIAGTHRDQCPSLRGHPMETILILGLLAFCGYKLLKFNTAAGREAVRAHSYLEILRKGASVEDANAITDKFLGDLGSEIASTAITMAKLDYEQVHKGKKLPLIGHAYRRGLKPTMPNWYTSFVRKVPETAAMELSYRLTMLTPVDQEAMSTDTDSDMGFKAFYETFANEVQRIHGESSGNFRIVDIMEDEPFRRAHKDGIDPLVLAVEQCELMGKIERFPSYQSYHDALATELTRLYADPSRAATLVALIDPAWLTDKFTSGIHPRRIAVACFEAATA